jgi:YhcG PDDEXK nuclease domain
MCPVCRESLPYAGYGRSGARPIRWSRSPESLSEFSVPLLPIPDFYIDLLFYNRKLKRLVVVELKQGAFRADYKGQMELYLRWLAKYEREAEEALPLGIILCAGASTRQVELLELDAAGIHVAEYLTVLPSREVLQRKLQEAITTARLRFDSKEDV